MKKELTKRGIMNASFLFFKQAEGGENKNRVTLEIRGIQHKMNGYAPNSSNFRE